MEAMSRARLTPLALVTATLATPALADDLASRLLPVKPGYALAHPVASIDIAPPPFSLIADRPARPAYVPGLPGLPQARQVADDFGRKPPKYDAVLIRKSRVENGEVVIPAGGLVYHEDTWGGEVALRGEQIPVLGKLSTYVDYDMSIVVKDNVTIPAGQSATVGGQVYQYYAPSRTRRRPITRCTSRRSPAPTGNGPSARRCCRRRSPIGGAACASPNSTTRAKRAR